MATKSKTQTFYIRKCKIKKKNFTKLNVPQYVLFLSFLVDPPPPTPAPSFINFLNHCYIAVTVAIHITSDHVGLWKVNFILS